jgi:choline kinase
MQLLILSAGYGGRLSPVTEHTPKALLDIYNGITVLDRQIEVARICDIKDINIVIGYEAEQIEAKLAERNNTGIRYNTFYNPFFRTTNNLVSLWMARSAMLNNDFIMINGDNVFKPSVLKELIETPGDFTALISRKLTYDNDDVKIITADNSILKLGKDLNPTEANAEWVGICAVRGGARIRFINLMDSLIRNPLLRDGSPHYLSLFQGLIDSGLRLEYFEIDSSSIAEIDYQKDLDYVRGNIAQFLE